MPSRASTDKYREWIAQIGSGLEQLWDALLHSYDSASYKSMLELGFQCLILRSIFTILPYLAPSSFTYPLAPLFYPTLFLYRYLNPDPWDRLFMNTVRALECADRTDIVAKPSPKYYNQLERYIRRAAKAYVGVGTLQYLVGRTGFFSWPSIIMGLMATREYLKFKGIKKPSWMLFCAVLFIGPRWPVWLVRTIVLQEMLMYELLQPYLVRVDFKSWEERAWLSEHALELQGFALGAYFLCNLPFVGPAFIPVLFPAVAFLLTRSCGSMRNTSNGMSGDLLERLCPGSKIIALGQSKSVSGDWDQTSVSTLVRDDESKTSKASTHIKPRNHYKISEGVHGAVSTAEAMEDKDRTHHIRGTMHREAEKLAHGEAQRFRRRRMESPSSSSTTSHSISGGLSMIPGGFPSDTLPSQPSTNSSSNSNRTSKSKGGRPTKGDITREDYTKYNFSDRKTDASAPSAPPPPSGEGDDWQHSGDDSEVFREIGEPQLNSGTGPRTAREQAMRDAKEQRRWAKQQRILAKEQRRAASQERARARRETQRATSQRRPAGASSTSGSETSDSDTSGSRTPHTKEKESKLEEELEEGEEEDELLEEDEDEEEGEEVHGFDLEETIDDPYMTAIDQRGGFGFRGYRRGWERGRGRGTTGGWTRGGRGGRGNPRGGGRGLFRGQDVHGEPNDRNSGINDTERRTRGAPRAESEGGNSSGIFDGISGITASMSNLDKDLKGLDSHLSKTIKDSVSGWLKKWENPDEPGSYIMKINSLNDLFSNENNDKSKKKKK
ncbi:hypothetical protein EMPS_01151 [Entomortierella parvispora]|uniref:Uncharacterized protein n=1 Tax=Entomortierella parvispora TaxID=205924 RepID=A0A9P3H2B9_9FUNG|nr:hypothetical protein EMPS_01151 [Entomortierella parvispora]